MEPVVVDRETWLETRQNHLADEKAFTRARDQLSESRRQLPWMEVTGEYVFDTDDGPRTLAQLFGGSSQLIVYHFMMGPGWIEGCPSCSFWADNFDGVDVHLAARDTALVAVSRAPLGEIAEYRRRMGWNFVWVSSQASPFNYDMGVSFEPSEQPTPGAYNFGTQAAYGEESPGVSVFVRNNAGQVFLTYQTFSRGLDMINGAYHMLDLTPKGRDEAELGWSMEWLHRHDAYPDEA